MKKDYVRARHVFFKPRPRHRIGPLLLALGLGLFSSAYFVLQDLNQAQIIKEDDVDKLITGGEKGEATTTVAPPNGAMNILVIGSDIRTPEEEVYEEVDGQRADATMLIHISADRSNVTAVSIPRDTLVEIPDCMLTDNSVVPGSFDKFNAAFSVGGSKDLTAAVACAKSTIQNITSLTVTDYFVVDFSAFQEIIDSLGGITICQNRNVFDPAANYLRLVPGCYRLNGEQALGYSRSRKSLDNGSDLDRIGSQQKVVSAIVSEVFSRDLVGDLPTLYNVLRTGMKSLTASELGRVENMAGLAVAMRNIDRSNIRFVMAPVVDSSVLPGAVEFSSEAEILWDALRNDRPAPDRLGGTDGNGDDWTQTHSPTPQEVDVPGTPGSDTTFEGRTGKEGNVE